jgi:PAS domain S-box-containing protein
LALLRDRTPLWIVAGIGLLLSVAAWVTIQHQLNVHKRVEFEWVARERMRALSHEIDSVTEATNVIRSVFSFAGEVSSDDFRQIQRSIVEHYPGVQALAWVPRRPIAPCPRPEGGPLGPAGAVGAADADECTDTSEHRGPDRFPVLYVAPDTAIAFAPGQDLAADPALSRLLERARDQGRTAVSGRIPLGGEHSGHYGFAVCLPVYRRDISAASATERREQLSGFAVGVFRLDDLAHAAISLLEPRGVDLVVFDTAAPEGERFLVFYGSRLGPEAPSNETELEAWLGRSVLRLTKVIEAGDRRWTITAAATSHFRSAEAFEHGALAVLAAGSLFTALLTFYVMRMRQGLLVRLGMERRLREREQLFWQMTETIDQVVFALPADMQRFLYVSPACERLWGLPNERLYHDPGLFWAAVHRKDRRRLATALGRLQRERTNGNVEVRLVRGGARHWLRIRAFAVLGPTGELDRIVGYAEDITAERLAEKALRKSERKLRTLFNQSPDIIMTLDLKGHILLLNRSLPGMSVDEAIGQGSEVLVPPEFQAWYRKTLDAVFQHGTIEHFSYPGPDATWWEVRMVPIKVAKRISACMVIATDITEKQLLQGQAMRQARLASVGVLSAGVAHEINNPNNAILFNAGLVKRAWHDAVPILSEYHAEHGDFSLAGLSWVEAGDTLPRLLEDIGRNAERIKRIIQNLKHLVRQGEEKLDQSVNVANVLREAIMVLHHQIQQRTDAFSLELAEELPPTTGDAQQLEQVFINLILNALESLPGRERGVSVACRLSEGGDHIEVEVRDEGLGMPEADLMRVAEPFFSTKTASGGTGLGLSIAKSILDRHHGTLTFKSRPGTGTRALVRLPLRPTGAAP